MRPQSKADAIDKYTILLLKQEHGFVVAKELAEYSFTYDEYVELYDINLIMWELEELITKEDSLVKIGAYCLALRLMNKRRVAVKNKINAQCGEHLEEKSY